MIQCDHMFTICAQRKCQGILANNTNWCHSNIDCSSILVWIGEQEIVFCHITLEQFEGLICFSQSPNQFSTSQRSRSVHFHITCLYIFIKKFKCLMILNWIPSFANISQNLSIKISNQCLFTCWNFSSVEFYKSIQLEDFPVQSCHYHKFLRG